MVLFYLFNHFINSLNQFRSVENCLDMFKINFNFGKEKKTFSGISKIGEVFFCTVKTFCQNFKNLERAVKDNKTIFFWP